MIAVLCPLYGVVTRGAESLVRDIVNYLQTKHTVDIYSLSTSKEVISVKGIKYNSPFLSGYNSFFNFFNLKIPYINPSDLLLFSFSKSAIYKMFKENKKYDIIWNNSSYWGDIFCALYRRKTGTPFITTQHGLPYSRLPNFNYGNIFGITIPQPNKLITFTENLKKQYLAKNISVIPNGIDIKKFTPDEIPLDLNKYGIHGSIERPIVLSTATLEPIKRIHLLIEAMKVLNKGTLILLNDGTLKRSLLKYGKESLGKRFIYLGTLKNRDLVSAYTLCDVFCLPSKYETFSIAILEALSTNKPVVTQYCETRKQVIGNAGVLVEDASNIISLAKAIERAYNNNYGSIPRERALKYSIDIISKKYEMVIKEVTNLK